MKTAKTRQGDIMKITTLAVLTTTALVDLGLVQKKSLIKYLMRDSKKAATYSSTSVVPSALTGLTSLFGKVRGEPRRYNHLNCQVSVSFLSRPPKL